MSEVGGENPGAKTPGSDVIKPKEARNGQDIVVQSFLRASALLSEFPAEKLTPQQLAAKDLMTWATRKTIDSKKGTFRNKFDSTDGLKAYTQEEGIPVDELISFLQERVQSGELDRKDTQTYKKLGRTLLQNSTSYYDAHRMGTRETLARVQREAARIRDDKRLATGDAKDDYLKAQSLLLQRRELIIPPKDKQPTVAANTQNADVSPVIPPETPSPVADGATPSDTTEAPIIEANEATAGPDATSAEAWTPSLFDEPIKAAWKNKDTDAPIKITGYMGKGPDGKDYFSIEEGTTGVPIDEIDAAPDVLDSLRTKIPVAEETEKVDTSSPTNLDENSEPPPPYKTETSPIAPDDTNNTEDETIEEYGETTEADAKKGESPATPESEETPTTTPLEDIRRDFYIASRTRDVIKRATELAQQAVTDEQRRGSGFNPLNWARKVRMRIFEEFYRQRYIDRASHAMIENSNTYLEMDVINNAVINAKRQIDDERAAGQSKIEGLRTGERTVGEDVRQAEGEIKTALMNDLIRPIVTGEITNYEQVQERLRAFVEAHRGDPQIQELFGADANQWGRQADYFATDLLEMGNVVKADIAANKYALDQLDKHVNIQLANTDWAAETQAQFTTADRAVAWAQSNRMTGLLGNPAFVGAVTSIGIYGTMRALGVGARAADWVPGAGMLTGAAFAGIRRNYDIKVDRASDQTTEAYNMHAEGRAPRREALRRYNYETASVGVLLNGNLERGTVGGDTRGLRELLRLDLSDATNREALLRRASEIRTRLDFSARESVDLVTFESRETVEQGRLELTRGIVEARLALQNAGMTREQIAEAQTRFAGEWDARFTQNRDQQDRAFRNYRLRNVAGAAAFGGLAGLASGLAVKEALTAARDHLGIDINPVGLINEGAGKIKDFKDLFQKGGTTKVGNYNISAGADHSLSITNPKTGETITGWRVSENGHVTATNASPDVVKQFENAGFEAKDGGETTRTTFGAAGATEHQSIPGADGAQHETLVPQGTKWVRDIESGKYDLVDVNNQNTKLVNDAAFGADGKLTYDEKTSLLKGMKLEGGTKQVFGPDGEWAKHSKAIDHREWYSYDKPNSQGNELGFDTYKNGNSITLDMTRMGLGYQNGLNPNPIDVQQAIARHEVGFAISNPADPQNPIWVSDGADGIWDGKVTLSATNANSEIYKMVVNRDALAKLSDGNIATELTGRQEIFTIGGADGKMGTIEAGRLVPGQNGTALQTFATIRGSTPTPTVTGGITIPSFSVDAPITEAVHVTELIPPSEREIPIIPIPFAPRHPLEALVPGIGVPEAPPVFYYGGENVEEAKEWIKANPQAHKPYKKSKDAEGNEIWVDVDGNPVIRDIQKERDEIEAYLKTLETKEPSHSKLINELAAKLPPMKEKTRAAVNVPAWLEGKNIRVLLNEYTKQVDKNGNELDPDLYEINIIVNRKTGTPSDNSVAEIERFKTEAQAKGKNYNINYVDIEFDEPFNNVGNARRVITDTTLVRSLARPTQTGQLYIESEDADLLRVDPHTVSNLIDKLDFAPHLDAVRGIQDRLPETMMTNDYLFLYRRAQDFKEMLLRRGAYRPERNQAANYTWNRIITGGWNTGYTAQAYAMIGGYNPYQTKGEDMIMGERFSMARGDGTTPNTEVIGKVATRSDSSPRRYIWETASGKAAYGPDFEDENVNKELRDKTPEELMARISHLSRIDNANTTTFQSMLNSEYQFVRSTTPNEMEAQKVTRAILGYLGLKREDYRFGSNGNLEIHKWDNVRDALNNYRTRHAAPRKPGERVGNKTTTEIPRTPTQIEAPKIQPLTRPEAAMPTATAPAAASESLLQNTNASATIQAETAESTTPTTDTEALQSAREELGTITTPTETVIAAPIDVLDPSDKWAVDAIEQGGTPIPNALKIEDIVDGQECITPSGHKGKVIDHITLPDGSHALRIEITDGRLKGMWAAFDQEDLNNGKVETWTAPGDTPPSSTPLTPTTPTTPPSSPSLVASPVPMPPISELHTATAVENPTETPKNKTAFDKINETLSSSTSEFPSLALELDEFQELFKTIELPQGTKLEGLTHSFLPDGSLKLDGNMTAIGGNSSFSATIETENGEINILSFDVKKTALRHRLFIGQIKREMDNASDLLRKQLNQRLTPGWKTQGFSIKNGQFNIGFERKA